MPVILSDQRESKDLGSFGSAKILRFAPLTQDDKNGTFCILTSDFIEYDDAFCGGGLRPSPTIEPDWVGVRRAGPWSLRHKEPVGTGLPDGPAAKRTLLHHLSAITKTLLYGRPMAAPTIGTQPVRKCRGDH